MRVGALAGLYEVEKGTKAPAGFWVEWRGLLKVWGFDGSRVGKYIKGPDNIG